MFVYPYRAGSRSATALTQAIKGKLIRRTNSRFKPGENKTVINWGSTDIPDDIATGCKLRGGTAEQIRGASNKRNFFQLVDALPREELKPRVPDWTLSKETARSWLEVDNPPVLFARTVLAGHSGEGIVKVRTLDELEPIREGTLIVKYVPKRHEFRIHVGNHGNTIISHQQKMRSREVPDDQVDFQVRNTANGFIFARNDIVVPEDVETQAMKGLAATGLEFGAVDVIYNERRGEAYVLEVNTAPGLTGTTVTDYANYFLQEG